MSAKNYANFDLMIEKTGDEYRARVLNSPDGEATTTFKAPFTALELENFTLRLGQAQRRVRRIDSPEMQNAKLFGQRLFRTVFAGEIGACLQRSLAQAALQEAGLRLRLRLSDARDLMDIPWEYLYDADVNRFLALSIDTPLVRYLDQSGRIAPLLVKPPLKVLTVISSPTDFLQLDVEEEWRKLQEAVADLESVGLLKLERLDVATLEQLQRQLRRQEYHVFHFIGHGGFDEVADDGVLLMEDDQGRGRAVSGQTLGMLMHDEKSLRLALLNACEGGRTSADDPFSGVGQSLLQQGIPAVIAMQREVTDDTAITMAHEFYAALADGYPVDAALTEARKSNFVKNDLEWGTPVLYMRAPDGRIFDVDQAALAAVRQENAQKMVASPPVVSTPLPKAAAEASPVQPANAPTMLTAQPAPTKPARRFGGAAIGLLLLVLGVLGAWAAYRGLVNPSSSSPGPLPTVQTGGGSDGSNAGAAPVGETPDVAPASATPAATATQQPTATPSPAQPVVLPTHTSPPPTFTPAPPVVNKDHYADLIWNLKSSGQNFVKVGQGAGQGTFDILPNEPYFLQEDWQNYKTLVGDVDGDGRSDLIWNKTSPAINRIYVGLAAEPGTFKLLMHQDHGGTQWQEFKTLVGDVNGDGRDDLIWNETSAAHNRVYVGLAQGNDNFHLLDFQDMPYPSWADYKTLVGDVNGDGKADLIWNKTGADKNRMYAGISNGDGTFNLVGPQDHGGGDWHWFKTCALDVNGDGRTDLVWNETTGEHNRIYVGLAAGDGTFRLSNYFQPDGRGWATYKTLIGDVNGDRRADLIWNRANDTGSDQNRFYVGFYVGGSEFRIGDAQQYLDAQGNVIPGWKNYQTLVGDLNGDGMSDLIWNEVSGAQNRIYTGLSRGDGFFDLTISPQEIPGDWRGYQAFVGHMNGDKNIASFGQCVPEVN
ncbi:MAG: CHAT domain-containing protein [Caldilineaceae bacterium]